MRKEKLAEGENIVRVITGDAKGRHLKSVKGMKTRPTSDRVKESLFSILNPMIVDAKFLDLYAGTGSIGIEALSRGARMAVFVENARTAAQVIRENLKICGMIASGSVMEQDVLSAISRLSTQQMQFTVIYVDPPYDAGFVIPTLQAVAKHDILSAGGIIVVETRKGKEEDLEVEGLTQIRRSRYGDTVLQFYKKTDE
jgi:16S rRNA (guanine(966)-N(2))-methyltransferase RsmD